MIAAIILFSALGSLGESDTETTETNRSVVEVQDETILEDTESNIKNEQELTATNIETSSDVNNIFEGYNLLEVDGGDMLTDRKTNVVVDIGFGDREYYAFTNEYGQVIQVLADEIILQNDENELVQENGRYYRDEADMVPENVTGYDNGHIIADSLGGVANAYNITPQNSTLNQHGDQAYMEQTIRSAGGCTDFVGIITYSDTSTMIPDFYKFTFKINGKEVEPFAFANENPEAIDFEPADTLNTDGGLRSAVVESEENVDIIKLDKKAEYVIIKNNSEATVNLKGWRLLSVRGEQQYTFGDYDLEPAETLKIGDSKKNPDVDIHWLEGKGIWNNSKDDDAELYNSDRELVSRYDD